MHLGVKFQEVNTEVASGRFFCWGMGEPVPEMMAQGLFINHELDKTNKKYRSSMY